MKSEFKFLENIRKKFNLTKIGDDCAVLPKDSKTDLVITTDLLVEDIDFRLDWTTPEFLGHKSLAVSLSDVAAMGAKPVWSMLSIGIPQKIWNTDFVDKFYKGYFELANKFSIELVGGDVSKTPDKIVIDSIAAGELKKGKAVLRSGAKVGDLIYITGELGGASAGLKLLENGDKFNKANKFRNLLLRQLKPNPRTEIGQVLQINNLSFAMIDISDGLSSDLMHICRESKVGAKIFVEKIPIDKNIPNISSKNLDILDFALNGGEDFELLFTSNQPDLKKKLKIFSSAKNVKISYIGEITKTPEIIELISENGSQILSAKGFRHF
jgi:thiamine-monophosphate kinase